MKKLLIVIYVIFSWKVMVMLKNVWTIHTLQDYLEIFYVVLVIVEEVRIDFDNL